MNGKSLSRKDLKGLKSKIRAVGICLALSCAVLAGCGLNGGKPERTDAAAKVSESSAETSVGMSAETGAGDSAAAPDAAVRDGEKEEAGSAEGQTAEQPDRQREAVRVGSLKGPTSIGLLPLKDKAENGLSEQNYEFTMATAADELLPLVVKGDLDIALLPANVAAMLYHKTEGGIRAIGINTLNVLYLVSGDGNIAEAQDLKGRTIYLTGKGTTPDYVLRYILKENGLEEADYTLEYKSEPTEVAALLAENPEAAGLLPQPFVTVACAQNEALDIRLDMDEEWKKLSAEEGTDSSIVTGVTVVRVAFLEENREAVDTFLREHAESAEAVGENPEQAAKLVVEAGIIAKEPVALKAIPKCGIVCLDGEAMRTPLSAYLQVLYGQNPESVGGSLPGEDFYYLPEK